MTDLTKDQRKALAGRVRHALGRGILAFAEAGRELLAAKAMLRHGEWLRFLARDVEIPVRHADQLMRLAQLPPELLRELATVTNLSPGVALELASPSMPRAVVRAVSEGSIQPTVRSVRSAARKARGLGYRTSPSPARTLDLPSAAERFDRALIDLDQAAGGSDDRASKAVADLYRSAFQDPNTVGPWATLVLAIAEAMRAISEEGA